MIQHVLPNSLSNSFKEQSLKDTEQKVLIYFYDQKPIILDGQIDMKIRYD